MTMMERSEAIDRAQRALKALGEHPRSSQKELGHAREHLNACYSHGDSDQVWDSVAKVETMAVRRYGVPSAEEQRTDPAAAVDLEELRQLAVAAMQRTLPFRRRQRVNVQMQARLTTSARGTPIGRVDRNRDRRQSRR